MTSFGGGDTLCILIVFTMEHHGQNRGLGKGTGDRKDDMREA